MDRKKSPPPDRHPRKPKLRLPPGACDAHFHFFGPQDVFPLQPQRAIDIDDSTIDDRLPMQDLALDWVPDEATRRRIFVDNPAELLGFPPVAG